MDLSRISIRARLRSNWEAIDLGFLMARAWWLPLFLSWAIPSGIAFLVLIASFAERPWIAAFTVWWLKPLWDRYPLFIASRAMFGEHISVAQTLKESLSLLKRDALPALLWRRFSLTRSFDLAVTVLEGVQGKQRRQRLSPLHHTAGSTAIWLTIVCIHIEWVIFIGLIGLVAMLIPRGTDYSLMQILGEPPVWAQNLLIYLAMALVAPFYTTAGFALYINRRINLEAWDVEVRFRHLLQHNPLIASLATPSAIHSTTPTVVSKGIPSAAPALIPLTTILLNTLLLSLSLTVASPPSMAQDHESPTPVTESSHNTAENPGSTASAQSQQLIDSILQGDDFLRLELENGWRFKGEEKPVPQWYIALIEFLESLGGESKQMQTSWTGAKLLANIVEFVLWVVVISLVIYLFYRYRHALKTLVHNTTETNTEQPAPPEILFGLDIRQQTIPENTETQALELWQRGQHREALGLLYRATLSGLVHRYEFHFKEGFTEQECAEIVAASAERTLSTFVSELTRVWQHLAYGHRLPREEDVYALCNRWPEIFCSDK